jgi:hypothetical protein
MRISRRTILKAAGALPLAVGNLGMAARAQMAAAAPAAGAVPPVLFVHGNGDHAALWITTLWRMESNGVARERMSAINFTDPLARKDDDKPEPMKSSTEDQRRELGEAIKQLKRRTGCRGRPPRARAVQRGADRRAGLAGIGKQDCDRRADLLAIR